METIKHEKDYSKYETPENIIKITKCQLYIKKWYINKMIDQNALSLENLTVNDKDFDKETLKIQSIIRGFLVRNKIGLTSHRLKNLVSHKNFKPPKTQLEFYMKNNASKEIIPYVILPGKTFGEKYMESIAKEYFNLNNRNKSSHDHIKQGKSIEQKSARYHANGDDWKWQHIEMKHEWDYLLVTGLDFKEIVFYIASRQIIENLIIKKVITGQGKIIDGVAQPQQAYWFSRSDFSKKKLSFTDYFTKILNENDIIKYLNNN